MAIRAYAKLVCDQDPDGESLDLIAKTPEEMIDQAKEWLMGELPYLGKSENFAFTLAIYREG